MLVHTQVNFFCLYGVVNPRPTITCTCDLVRLTIVSKKSKSVHNSITQSVVHELQDRTMTQDAFVSIESCLAQHRILHSAKANSSQRNTESCTAQKRILHSAIMNSAKHSVNNKVVVSTSTMKDGGVPKQLIISHE